MGLAAIKILQCRPGQHIKKYKQHENESSGGRKIPCCVKNQQRQTMNEWINSKDDLWCFKMF